MEIVGLCLVNTGTQSWRCASSPGLFPLFHLKHLSASQQCNRGHGRNLSHVLFPHCCPVQVPGRTATSPSAQLAPHHDLKSIPDPPGEDARTVSMLSIPFYLEGKGDGSLGPICVCGISPLLQPLGVGLAAQ